MNHILEKISFKNNEIFLLGNFNINLLNYETYRPTAEFLDDIYWDSFASYITLPTQITPRSKTLIDNIFLNDINEVITSGNLITNISDHLVQFLITSNVLKNKPNKLILKRCFKKFNEDLFVNDLQKTKWKVIFKTDLNDVNFFFSQLILKINELLDIRAPFK